MECVPWVPAPDRGPGQALRGNEGGGWGAGLRGRTRNLQPEATSAVYLYTHDADLVDKVRTWL